MTEDQESTYGGFWIRVLAIFVDTAILTVAMVIITVASYFLGDSLAIVGSLILFVVNLLYFPLMHSSQRQATFGKQMLGLKVAHAVTGERISFLRAVGRYLATLISSAVFGLGFIVAAFTRRKQALHDLIASTVVVREGEAYVGRAIMVCVAGIALVVGVSILLGAAALGGIGNMMKGEMAQSQPTPQRTASVPKPASKPAPPAKSPAAAPAPPAATATAPLAAPPEPADAGKPVVASDALSRASPVPSAPPSDALKGQRTQARVDQPVREMKPAEEKPAPAKVEPQKVADAYTPWAAVVPSGPLFSPRFNDLMTAVLYRDHPAVEELLAHGWWPDKADSLGRTPLIVAAEQGDARIAESLLKAGANPDAAGGGQTAGAIARMRGDTEMLSVLQRHGAR